MLFCFGSLYFNLYMITLKKKKKKNITSLHYSLSYLKQDFTFIPCSSYILLNILRQLLCLIFAKSSGPAAQAIHTQQLYSNELPLGKSNLNSRQSISVIISMCLIGRLWIESESHVSNKLAWVSVFGDERKKPYDLLLNFR